jgi:EMC6-arch
MEIDAKLTAVHAVLAIIAAYLSFLLSSGAITSLGKNMVLAVLIGLIILYLGGQISERIFGKEAVGGFKGWFWSGIIPFFFVWVVVWVILFNFY